MKAFGYFYEDYRSEKFVNHADALNLWLNLTTDLISKVQVRQLDIYCTSI